MPVPWVDFAAYWQVMVLVPRSSHAAASDATRRCHVVKATGEFADDDVIDAINGISFFSGEESSSLSVTHRAQVSEDGHGLAEAEEAGFQGAYR